MFHPYSWPVKKFWKEKWRRGETDPCSWAKGPFRSVFVFRISVISFFFKPFAILRRKRQRKKTRRILQRSVFLSRVLFQTLPCKHHLTRLWTNRRQRQIPKVRRRWHLTHLTKLHMWPNNQNKFPLPGFGPTYRDAWHRGAKRVLEEIPHGQALPCAAAGHVSWLTNPETHETTADAFWKLSHQDHTSRPSKGVNKHAYLRLPTKI